VRAKNKTYMSVGAIFVKQEAGVQKEKKL